jgi:hypothetical protein
MPEPSSSDSVSTLELAGNEERNPVSRLEAAAMKEKMIKSSSKTADGDSRDEPRIQYIAPAFDSSNSESSQESENNESTKSLGSFSAETAREESIISPTEG